MKVFAVLLLVLNGAVWGVLRWLGPAEEGAAQAVAATPQFSQMQQRLVLLGEVETPAPLSLQAEVDGGEFVDIALADALAAPPAVEEEGGADSQLIPEESVGETAVVAERLSESESAVVVEPVSEPEAVVVESEPAPAPEAVVALTPWCANGEGSLSAADAGKLVSAVQALGGQADVSVRDVPVSYVWWVYLGGFESEAAASQTLKELQAKKIDSFYMRTGELAGGISLGVFSKEASALTHSAGIQKKGGYQPQIGKVARTQQQNVVEVQLPDDTLQATQQWQQMLAKFPKVKLQEIACK
jgi:hypothetical protein